MFKQKANSPVIFGFEVEILPHLHGVLILESVTCYRDECLSYLAGHLLIA